MDYNLAAKGHAKLVLPQGSSIQLISRPEGEATVFNAAMDTSQRATGSTLYVTSKDLNKGDVERQKKESISGVWNFKVKALQEKLGDQKVAAGFHILKCVVKYVHIYIL